ncbi:MAG: SurA N-terminal domain-containing protein [Hyphomicrobiales bacterium]
MLEYLRTATAGWVAKGFIGVLVLSFAVWGIADIFNGGSSRDVATVGDIPISQQAFQNAFQNELNQVANRLGRQLSPDEARAVGLDRRVLSELLTSATLSNQARALKLGISDDVIAKSIVQDAAFRDSFGNFDRQLFEQILAQSGIDEAAYVAEQRQRSTSGQRAGGVSGSLTAPAVLRDAFADFQSATRVVDYFAVPPVDTASISAPDEQVLTAFYNANKSEFTLPEFREFSILSLRPESMISSISIDESDIVQEYEARKASYVTQERRQVEQIPFPDADQAALAAAKINTGTDFAEVAKEFGYSASDIELGLVERSAIVDPAIAEAAFSMEVVKVSQPVKTTLGSALVRVLKIEPAKTRELEEVRNEITRRLALEKATEDIIDLQNSIEDERAGGLSLKEIAAKFSLDQSTVAAMDKDGKNTGGTLVDERFRSPDILRSVFEFQVGEEADPIELASGGVIWLDVLSVQPPRLQDFADVRDKVETGWRLDQVKTRLGDIAGNFVKQGNSGTPISEMASKAGGDVLTSQPFVRRGAGTPFSPAFAQAAFAVGDGGFVSGRSTDGKSVYIATVTKQIAANAAQINAGLDTTIVAALGNDLFAQYVGGLQTKFGVSVDGAVLQALTGSDPDGLLTPRNNTDRLGH